MLKFSYCAFPKTLLYRAALLSEWEEYIAKPKGEPEPFEIQKLRSRMYRPVFYVRVLLMLATFLAISAGGGIIAVPLIDFIDLLGVSSALLFSLLSVAFSVFMARFFAVNHHHFQSGVDDALAWQAFGSAGVSWWALLDLANVDLWSHTALLGMAFISAVFSFLYINRLFALAAFLLAILSFYWILDHTSVSMLWLPVLVALLSGVCFWCFNKFKGHKWYFYESYFSFNRQISLFMLMLSFQPNLAEFLWQNLLGEASQFPLYHVFLAIFVALSAFTIYFGWKRRNQEWLRVGGLAGLISLWSLMETAGLDGKTQLLVGGLLAGVLAFRLIKAIETGTLLHFGFRKTESSAFEMVAVHVLQHTPADLADERPHGHADDSAKLGGGDFGGAGATGQY